jgi:elongation factor 1-alpha
MHRTWFCVGKSAALCRLQFELHGFAERNRARVVRDAQLANQEPVAFLLSRWQQEKRWRASRLVVRELDPEFTTATDTLLVKYTVLDAPGHRNFIRATVRGEAPFPAHVALVVVSADAGDDRDDAGGFPTALWGDMQLLRWLGCGQFVVVVNKMDAVAYSEEAFKRVRAHVAAGFVQRGWKPEEVEHRVAIIPVSLLHNENVLTPSVLTPWWAGICLHNRNGHKILVHTLLNCLESPLDLEEDAAHLPLRLAVGGVYSIRGIGNVVTGRLDQGIVVNGLKVAFVPKRKNSGGSGSAVVASIQKDRQAVATARAPAMIAVVVTASTKATCLASATSCLSGATVNRFLRARASPRAFGC